METRHKVMITFLSLIAITFIFYSSTQWISKTTGYAIGVDEKAQLAQCLSGKNMTLYVTSNCPDCLKQREVFGSSFSQIKYIDCTDYKTCPKLSVFPSWKINGTIIEGIKSLEELKDISNCK